MIFNETFAANMSGSIGGVTASRNRGGAYLKTKSNPTNPQTAQQNVVRNAMANSALVWSTDLTQAQRDAWDLYAENVTLVNKIGNAINVTGFNMFIRANNPAAQAGVSAKKDGPTIFDTGAAKTMAMVASTVSVPGLTISIPGNSVWNDQTGSHALIFVARPQGVTQNARKNGYQYVGKIDGDDTTAPTSQIFNGVPFQGSWVVNDRIWVRIRVLWNDGRFSPIQEFKSTING